MKLWDVIEYTENSNILVYKHPCEDFNKNTKLIVREGQTAVFVKNGKLCDCFLPGRYSLSASDLPILRSILAFATDGVSSFTAEVYFFNNCEVFNVAWGTSQPMELLDPVFNIIARVGANGSTSFKVFDSSLFMRNISGTTTKFENVRINDIFNGLVIQYIKNAISDMVNINNISLLKLNSCLVTVSEMCQKYINEKIASYGLKIDNFSIVGIAINENDLMTLKQALSKKAEMNIVGYTYEQERNFDVMEKAVSNQSTNSGLNSLLGLGIGMGVLGKTAKMSSSILNDATGGLDNVSSNESCVEAAEPTKSFCIHCGSKIPDNAMFCPVCGKKQN